MPITKDPKKLYIKNGNLPASYINGIASLIENGSTIKKINLPQDYLEGAFPNNSREEELKGSIISLSGNFINNNNHLSFNNGQYAIFNIYPNVEPFSKYLAFKIETFGANNSLTLQIFNKNNEKLYENTSVSSGNSSDGWFINWDLNSLDVGLEELSFKIVSNTNDMAVSSIFFNYDLSPQENPNIFKDILSKIGDKLTIETFENGFRIKKDGAYIYSACWGVVNLTTTGSNGTAITTVNFPFTFANVGGTLTSVTSQTPLYQNCGNGNNQVSSVEIYAQRTTAGTSGVRWYVHGR